MPKLTEDQIKGKIADGSIFALSVDTAVFDKYGCNLDFVVLNKLNQFAAGPVRVLFSEIVVNEMTNHIAQSAMDTQRALNKAIKQQAKRWKQPLDLEALPIELALSDDPREAAESQVSAYIHAVGGEVVPASGAIEVSDELLRRYFATEPPFEAKEQTKSEFPDGFALLSLEAVAQQNRKLILCVSPDGGWNRFAEQSEFLVCVSDLNAALSYFNDSGRNTTDQAMALWKHGDAPSLVENVELAFEYRLDGIDFYPDGSSGLEFESEPISAVMQSVDVEAASDPVIIAADEESVTFTINVPAVVAFEANFSFYVQDWFDRDYVSLGSKDFSVEDEIIFQLAITIHRNLHPEPEVIDIEIAKASIHVDFGYVEPFPGEDPTHEKY